MSPTGVGYCQPWHQQSRRTLAVVSPNYFASSFTAPEWAARFKEEATSQYDLLIPVRVRECEPPSLLGSIVHVDLVGLARDQARSRLLERIASIRLKPNEGPFHPGRLLPAAARSIPSEPDFPGGKAIVVLSDGTGNSAAKLFKTNVWRLYQALDLTEPMPSAQGTARQIAYYDDGVGTSSFWPLALLGGVFGWGLKRNVLDLYTFICRNYKPGDRIYAFGFSRGAFTIRISSRSRRQARRAPLPHREGTRRLREGHVPRLPLLLQPDRQTRPSAPQAAR